MRPLLVVLCCALALSPLYWTVPRSARLPLLALWCVALLLWWSPVSLAVLLAQTLLLELLGTRAPGLGVWLLVLDLAAYKVCRKLFSVDLPLGISYYTLRQVHYLAERDRGRLPSHSGLERWVYCFFAPVLLTGPIARFPEWVRDWRRQRFDAVLFSLGLERCLYGLCKVVILGDFLLSSYFPVLWGWLRADEPWLSTYGRYACVPLNAYCQLAGYSDVAIGVSLLFGFRVMENFDAPFWATNLADFWRRYHISLTSWCRDYVFTPLVARVRRPALGVLAAMVAMAFWHELSLRYLLWGMANALGIVVSQRWPWKLPPWLGRVLVFHACIATWSLISAP